MAVVGEAQVRIRPTTAGFGAEAESGILGGLRGVVAKGAAILGGLFVAREAIRGVSDLVGAGENLSKSQALVARQIANTGNIAHVSAPSLKAFAESQAAITGQAAGSITNLQQVLLRFTNIRNEVGKGNDIFSQAQVAIENVSGALGKGLQPAAIAVGKALQDPQHGLTALQRLGIQFTQDQKDQIKVLLASGDTLGAQKVILDHIQGSYAGAGAAAATFTQKLKASIQNAKEAIGQAIEPAVAAATTGLLPVIPEIGRVLSGAINAVIPAITPALKAIGPALEAVVRGLAPILLGFGTVLAKAFAGFAPIIQAISGVLISLAPLLKPIATAIGIIATAISAVATPAIQGFASIISQIAKAVLPPLDAALHDLAPVITEVAHIFGDTLGGTLDVLAPVIGQIADLLANTFAGALRAIAPVLPQVASALSGLAVFAADAGIAFLQALLPGLTAILHALTPLLPPLAQVAVAIGQALNNAIDAIGPSIIQLSTALGQGLAKVLVALAPSIPAIADALVRLGLAFANLLVQATPALVALINFGTTLINAIGVPVLVAIATALADVTIALAPIISNVNVLTPLLAFLATLWAVNKIVVFAQTVRDTALAIRALTAAMDFSRFSAFIGNLLGLGTAGTTLAGQMDTLAVAQQGELDAFLAALAVREEAGAALIAQDQLIATAEAELAAARLNADQVAAGRGLIESGVAEGKIADAEATQFLASQSNFEAGAAARAATAEAELNAELAARVPLSEAVDAAITQQTIAAGSLAAVDASAGAASFTALAGGIGLAIAAFVAATIVTNELFRKLQQIGGVAEAVGVVLGVMFLPFEAIALAVVHNFSAIVGVFEAIPGAVTGAAGAVGRFFTRIAGDIGGGVTSAVSAIGSFFADLPSEIASGIGGAASAIGGFFTSLGPAIGNALAGAASTVVSALPGLLRGVINFFNDLPAEMIAPFAETAGFIIGAMARVGQIVATALPGLFLAVIAFFQSLPRRIADAATSTAQVLVTTGAQLIEGIVSGATSAGPTAVAAIVDEFQKLPNQITNVLSTIPGVVTGALGTVGGAVSGALSTAASAISGALGGITSAVGNALTSAGAAAINGLVTAAQATLGAVVTFFQALPSVIVAAAGDAKSWLLDVGHFVIQGLVQGILEEAGALGNFFLTIVNKFIDGFKQGFKIFSPAQTMIPIGVGIIQGIVFGALNAVGLLLSFAASVPGRVLAALGNVASVLVGAGQAFIAGLVNGATGAVGNVLAFFGGIPSRLVGLVLNGASQFIGVGQRFISAILNGLTTSFGSLLSFFQTLPSSLLASVGNIGSQFVSIGTDIVTGIGQGIRNAPGVVESALGDLVHNAISFGKHILGISSPSAVAAQELGLPIPQGIALGIFQGATVATGAVQQMIAQLGAGARDALGTAFDPNASIQAVTELNDEIANAIGSNPKIAKAFAQEGTDATNAFNNALTAANKASPGLNLPTVKTGDVKDALAFYIGLNNATKGTAAQLIGIDNVVAAIADLDLSHATVGSESFASALELIAAKGQQLGLTGDAFNTFRDHVLEASGATAPQIKQIDDNMIALESTLGHPLNADQVRSLTSAVGDLSSTLPGTQQFTDAIGRINEQAASLGLSGPFLAAFQQDALGLGGAPVTSVNALADAMSRLALTASDKIGTMKTDFDSAFQALGNLHDKVGPTFSDLVGFSLSLSGAQTQAFNSIKQFAGASSDAALAILQEGGSLKDAKKAIDQSLPSLEGLLQGLGLNADAARNMALQILGIPASKASKVTTNADAEKLLVQHLQEEINHLQGKNVDVGVTVMTAGQIQAQLSNRLAAVQAAHPELFIGVNAKVNPVVPFSEAIPTIMGILNEGIRVAKSPELSVSMSNVDIQGASLHPIKSAGAVISSVIRDGFTPLTTTVHVGVNPPPPAVNHAIAELTGTLDQLVSTATGALPTVANSISNFQQAYANAFDVATKANAAFSAAERKLIADQKAAVDEATIFLDTDAVNKAAAAQKNAISSLRAAANPENFVKDLRTRNDQITQLQADLTKILKFGDTALAASIAAQGTAGLKLAQALSSDKSAASQAEKLLASGQSLQDKFSKFLTDTFGADFTGAAGQAGASAGQSLASQMADGLLGVLPAARAIVGQLKDVLSEDVSSGLTKQVQTVQQTVANATINPGTGLGAQGAQATPIVLTPTNTNEPAQQLTFNIDITLEDGTTVKTTIPVTVPKNPTSLVQNVQAKARAL